MSCRLEGTRLFIKAIFTLWRPDLRGRPVVVARNKEAKALGLKMGEPYFKIKREFERAGGIAFSGNYELYADMSQRVMVVLEEMVPRVEVYSIDESFLDLTGVRNCIDLETFGRQVRAKVLRNTGLTVGVGIAQTKMLAKLANFAAKKWEKTGGVVDLSNEGRQRKLMGLAPVEEVWSIGRRISKNLNI